MSRKKLERFKANEESPNVIQPGKPLFEKIKGQWHSTYFGNNNPIVLELACGRGEYTVGLAARHPELNFIGIDLKGSRLWKGSQLAQEQNLRNVAFLRIKIQQLEDFFAPGEVSQIWLIHPDPRPKEADARRRLTHPRFLQHYRNVSGPNVLVRLKTDSESLYQYTLEVLANPENKATLEDHTDNLYNSQLLQEHLNIHGAPIKTKYEELFMAKGCQIHYVKFRLP